jgi:hypothetical protein
MKIVKLKGITQQLDGHKKTKKSVLDSRKPDDVKIKLYMAQLFHDLKHYYGAKGKRSIKSQTTTTTSSGETQTEAEKSSIETQADMEEEFEDTVDFNSEIITSFPEKLQPKARMLLEKIGKVISWNAAKEIIHKGRVIPKSNIQDLSDYLIRRKSTKYEPEYFSKIEDSLNKAGIGDLCVAKF